MAGAVLLELVVLVVGVVFAVVRPVAPPPVGVGVVLGVVVAELLLELPLEELELLPELELESVVVPAVLVVLAVVAVEGDALPVVGTVSTGAPRVLPALAPPLPQAASASATAIAAASASNVREPGSETLCFTAIPNRRDDR